MSDPKKVPHPRRVYDDPDVQRALRSLEASLDESLKSPRRVTFREILGLRSKKGKPYKVVQVKNEKNGPQVIVAPASGTGNN